MSHYFAISVLISHVLVFHKKSKQLIYFKIAPLEDFNPTLVYHIESLVHKNEVQVVLDTGEYLEYSIDSSRLLLRSGTLCSVVLALNSYPNRRIREALEEFGRLLDSEWVEELTYLYSKYKGESRIFSRPRPPNRPIDQLIEECFHLQYALPHKINKAPTKMSKDESRVWEYGLKLAVESGYLVLGEYLSGVAQQYPDIRHNAPAIIIDFVNREHLTPIPLNQFPDEAEQN